MMNYDRLSKKWHHLFCDLLNFFQFIKQISNKTLNSGIIWLSLRHRSVSEHHAWDKMWVIYLISKQAVIEFSAKSLSIFPEKCKKQS